MTCTTLCPSRVPTNKQAERTRTYALPLVRRNGQIVDMGPTDVIPQTAIEPVQIITVLSTAELNGFYPPATTQEGLTALVGPQGSRVEYININGSWQVRAAVVITGAT